MKKLLLASVAALFLATGTAHAQAEDTNPEKCSCAGNRCNFACISEAPPEVVAALRKGFPDLVEELPAQIFDDRQLPRHRAPYTVAFDTKNWHRTCDLWLKPIKLGKCWIRHA
jgi:hypothetical protein